jgi:UDP-2,3-diacylglucosamine hydrolase
MFTCFFYFAPIKVQNMTTKSPIHIPIASGQKIYFASDFHLGAPTQSESDAREKQICRWLNMASADAGAIFLVGDLFDFWYEYKKVAPKGFIRFLGKLAEISDKGIPLFIFSGNHDLWMRDYLPQEIGCTLFHQPQEFVLGNHTFLIGHGDGLGPGDHFYKLLKKVFTNSVCQWLFSRVHPNLAFGLAHYWSGKSRISQHAIEGEKFFGEEEWLYQYSFAEESIEHRDFYVFGHRHLPLDMPIKNSDARYINLGEWINFKSYAIFDGENLELRYFEHDQKAHLLYSLD